MDTEHISTWKGLTPCLEGSPWVRAWSPYASGMLIQFFMSWTANQQADCDHSNDTLSLVLPPP